MKKSVLVTLLAIFSFLLGNGSMLVGLLRMIMKEETLTALLKDAVAHMVTEFLYGPRPPSKTNINPGFRPGYGLRGSAIGSHVTHAGVSDRPD